MAWRVLSWPWKIRAGKGSFFSGKENRALKKISAGRRPVSAISDDFVVEFAPYEVLRALRDEADRIGEEG
jgi:hypothetical protein